MGSAAPVAALLEELNETELTVRAAPPPPPRAPAPRPRAHPASRAAQVPDELAAFVSRRAGADFADGRAVRLVAAAAQAFAVEVLAGAKGVADNRDRATEIKKRADGFSVRDRTPTLLAEDLAAALAKHGVAAETPPYQLSAEAPR
jgi:hypothetical protein